MDDPFMKPMFPLLFNLGLRVSLVITEDRTSPCSFHCAGNVTCDNKTGECTHGCQEGWTGLTCTTRCPINCYKDACDWKTQQCVRGCKPGFTGTLCDKNCSVNCLGGKCDNVTGACFKGCKPTFSGPMCDIKCTNCGGVGSCDHQRRCTHGCVGGFQGETCSNAPTTSGWFFWQMFGFFILTVAIVAVVLFVKKSLEPPVEE